MTRDETGQLLAYDAWGRLVTVNTDGTGGVEITNLYDALNRWIKRNANEFYYTAQWQQIEERDAQGVEAQQVWSSVYIDAMVLRDRDSDNDGVMEATDERLYVVHDANFNITALMKEDGTWQVIERFIYDAYGARNVLDANWSFDADNLSDVGFGWGHQGGLHDLIAGLVYFRWRWLDTSLGRWMTQDPEIYIDSLSLYQAYLGGGVTALDPSGSRIQETKPSHPHFDENATDADICADADKRGFDGTSAAGIICVRKKDGWRLVVCVWRGAPSNYNPRAQAAVNACLRAHEEDHIRRGAHCKCGEARSTRPPGVTKADDEGPAYDAEIACLKQRLADCEAKRDYVCVSNLKYEIELAGKRKEEVVNDPNNKVPMPPDNGACC